MNLTHTTACSEGGDSGGSFIAGAGQAQGVLSGSSGDCTGKQPNTAPAATSSRFCRSCRRTTWR